MDPTQLNLSSLPWIPLDATAGFPAKPGIYFAIDSTDRIQYIGRSGDVQGRWKNHHRYKDLEQIGGIKICYLFVEQAELLPDIEAALIDWFDPPLNVVREIPVERKKSRIKTKNSDSSKDLGLKWRLNAVMADRDLDYKALAALTGIHPVTISKLKNRKRMPERLEKRILINLCSALDCQPGDLIHYVPPEDEQS